MSTSHESQKKTRKLIAVATKYDELTSPVRKRLERRKEMLEKELAEVKELLGKPARKEGK